jgi:hypothetical protein
LITLILWNRNKKAGCWWLTPAILATQEAEIGGSQFQASPGWLEKHTTKKCWCSGSRCSQTPVPHPAPQKKKEEN